MLARNMKKHTITEFLDDPGSKRPYRELIQHFIKKQSAAKLQAAIHWEVSNLPESFQDKAELYIDRVNQKLIHNKKFWVEANSYFAYKVIIDIAVKCFPLDNRIASHEDTLKPENSELAFILFQIPTLSFAYSASTQRKQRKFMGIRKGLFG
jgi:hypothetical protein